MLHCFFILLFYFVQKTMNESNGVFTYPSSKIGFHGPRRPLLMSYPATPRRVGTWVRNLLIYRIRLAEVWNAEIIQFLLLLQIPTPCWQRKVSSFYYWKSNKSTNLNLKLQPFLSPMYISINYTNLTWLLEFLNLNVRIVFD